MKPWLFSLLGATLIASCAHHLPPEPSTVQGLEAFQSPCDAPAVASDADLAALALLTPEDRERTFWAPRDAKMRGAVMCERARADGAVSTGLRFNEAVRASR